jgi:hypothetical protein
LLRAVVQAAHGISFIQYIMNAQGIKTKMPLNLHSMAFLLLAAIQLIDIYTTIGE